MCISIGMRIHMLFYHWHRYDKSTWPAAESFTQCTTVDCPQQESYMFLQSCASYQQHPATDLHVPSVLNACPQDLREDVACPQLSSHYHNSRYALQHNLWHLVHFQGLSPLPRFALLSEQGILAGQSPMHQAPHMRTAGVRPRPCFSSVEAAARCC